MPSMPTRWPSKSLPTMERHRNQKVAQASGLWSKLHSQARGLCHILAALLMAVIVPLGPIAVNMPARSEAAGAWNGAAITAWNASAITAWNGTGVSAAGGSWTPNSEASLVNWYDASTLGLANGA